MSDQHDGVEILGLRVHRLDWPALLGEIRASVASGRAITVMYLNVHVANSAQRSGDLREALAAADLVYCDGVGIRFGARILGVTPPSRFTAADFLWDLAADLASEQTPLFWLGGEQGVADRALAALRARHPSLPVAGAHHGFFAKEGLETEQVIAKINASGAQVVLVGLGTPQQEIWVHRQRHRFSAPVVWCVGAAADFVAGEVSRAPIWMRGQLEWLHRFVLEPRRLFRRYVIGNPLFIARVLHQRVGNLLNPRFR